MPKTILVLGESDREELRPLTRWIKARFKAESRCIYSPNVDRAFVEFSVDQFPDLMIVLQSWPNEFSTHEVTRLLSFAPLARIVVCYGAWCESDGRNRSIWPHSVRVPLSTAQTRIEREWSSLQSACDFPSIPLSASREEAFAAEQQYGNSEQFPPPILIDSPDVAYRQYLSECLSDANTMSEAVKPHSVCTVLFDADPWGTERIASLKRLQNQHSNAVIVALTSFVQPQIVEELRHLCVDRVLPKLDFKLL